MKFIVVDNSTWLTTTRKATAIIWYETDDQEKAELYLDYVGDASGLDLQIIAIATAEEAEHGAA